MKRECRRYLVCIGFLGVGMACLIGAFLMDGSQAPDLRSVGIVIMICSILRFAIRPQSDLLKFAMRPQSELFESGYNMGYSEGFQRGQIDRIVESVRIPDDLGNLYD